MNFLAGILFLDASSLVDFILGIVDFLELLLCGTAHVLAKSCDLVGMMFQRHLAIGCLHFIVRGIGRDAQNAVGIL